MLIAEKARRFEALVAAGDVMYPAAAACVRRLGTAWPLGIASGARRSEIEVMLRGARLSGAFKFIVAAGDTDHGKPAPDPYLRAAELHGARAECVPRDRGFSCRPRIRADGRHANRRHRAHLPARNADRRRGHRLARRAHAGFRPEVDRYTLSMRPRYNSFVPLSLLARLPRVTEDLLRAINEPGEALAPAAFAIAGVEYPALDAGPYLQRLERMGEAAAGRLQRHQGTGAQVRIATLNAYLYEELGFSGNRQHYDDPRNSFLNEVSRPADRYPDQPRGRLPRNRAARRPSPRRGQLPRSLPGARSRRTGGNRR